MDGGVKVEGIGCFVCTSIDGNNPLCDDEEKTGEKKQDLQDARSKRVDFLRKKTLVSGITYWNNCPKKK